MKHLSLTLLLLLQIGAAFSQLKPLTIEEAVIGQYRQFYPEQKAVTWVPGTDMYATIENESWYIAQPGKKALLQAAISLVDLNKKTGHNLSSLTETEWVKQGVLSYSIARATDKSITEVYEYNIVSGLAQLKYAYPNSFTNTTAHSSGKVCYTKEEQSATSQTPSFKFVAHYNNSDHFICMNPEGIVSGQSISRNEYGINNGSFWSPNGNFLAFYQKDEQKVTTYPLVDYKTTPATLKSIKYPMAGDQSEVVRVGVFNAATEKTVFLKLNNGLENDQYYATNLAWTPDEKYIVLAELNRQTTVCKVNLYDPLNGNLVRTLFTETDNKWVEPDQAPYFIDNNSFLWYSWRNGFHNYYLYDLNGKQLSNSNASFELFEILKISTDKNLVYVSGSGKIATEKHAFVWNIKEKTLTQLTQEAGTHEVTISGTGEYFVDQFQSVTTPNRVTICFSKDGNVVNSLLTATDKLKEYAIGKTEIFTLNANNGVPLYCRLIKPSNFDPKKKYPVVIYVYNGPHVQLVTNTYLGGASLWMNYLAEKGYLVFTLDGQGSAHRGKSFEQIIHRQLGEQEMADQLAGVE
ncbi:MAG: DPP IV N-terminal domain-containing protein [Bacteroidota bacterium]